jgi:hypothetical protein
VHAIMGIDKIDNSRAAEAEAIVKEVMTVLKRSPGFISAVFARTTDGTEGRTMILFETEEAAKSVMSGALGNQLPENLIVLREGGRIGAIGDVSPNEYPPLELVSADVYEVIASC